MSNYQTLAEIQAAIQAGETSCANLVEEYLNRIEERASINAFIETYADEARNSAREIDAKLANGTAGKLAGMVIGLKDNIVYKGHKVTASSKILDGFESLFSATVVERLLAEDAIIIGRLSCDEFAMGSSNEHSAYGPVKNPLDESRVPGGSSGGSAAAVAANLCHATLGSDTGGSIRQPASFTGTIGLKPTYGRISRYGLIAYGSSLDQIGPFTKSVEDAALLLEVMAGADEYDSTVSRKPVDSYVPSSGYAQKAKIVYLREAAEHPGLSQEVRENFTGRVESLRALGHTVEAVDFPYLDQVVPTYYIISNAEASSNLSRYDGIRFGHRSAETTDIESAFVKSRSEGFGAEVKRRIMLGTFVLSAGYYDAYYTKAQKVRRLIRDWTNAVFEDADFIITPTSPHAAFKFGSKSDDPVAMYLEDIFTVHANLAGIPGISIPMGMNKENMPLGLQLMAPSFEEAKLLAFAKYCVDEL
jgi:aspartyl-tRNA(Asn)/glutamyl-tRNA(Gln) amidotransferase subunit A